MGLYSSFIGLESSLWLLWQLAITGESFVILSPHARTCSQATLAFARCAHVHCIYCEASISSLIHPLWRCFSLISPIEFQGDCRPYYTLYETDFDVSSHYVHGRSLCFLCTLTKDFRVVLYVQELTRRQNTSASQPDEMTVIGTTNPFFLKVALLSSYHRHSQC